MGNDRTPGRPRGDGGTGPATGGRANGAGPARAFRTDDAPGPAPGGSGGRSCASFRRLARALERAGLRGEALLACDEGLDRFPGDPGLRFRKAVVLQLLGRDVEAAGVYEGLLVDDPDPAAPRSRVRHNLALIYDALDEGARAERLWRQAVDDEPGYRPAWRALGGLLVRLGRTGEASALADRLALDPDLHAEADLLRGRVAQARGDLGPARAALRAAADARPDDREALDAYCRFLLDHGPLIEAESVLNRLVRRRPNDAALRLNLGTVLLRSGRPADAVEAYRDALRLRPGDPDALTQLGRALAALGRTSDAARAWREAARRDPDAAEALDELRRLGPGA